MRSWLCQPCQTPQCSCCDEMMAASCALASRADYHKGAFCAHHPASLEGISKQCGVLTLRSSTCDAALAGWWTLGSTGTRLASPSTHRRHGTRRANRQPSAASTSAQPCCTVWSFPYPAALFMLQTISYAHATLLSFESSSKSSTCVTSQRRLMASAGARSSAEPPSTPKQLTAVALSAIAPYRHTTSCDRPVL